jgi:hypothetical protein
MEATTIYKELNNIFEELYYLFDESIMNSELINNQSLQKDIVGFMDTIRIESEWNMEDEEHEEFEEMYFESGHNGVDAVFYPFNPNCEEIDAIEIQNVLGVWENILICIQSYCKKNKYINKAIELEERLSKIKYY